MDMTSEEKAKLEVVLRDIKVKQDEMKAIDKKIKQARAELEHLCTDMQWTIDVPEIKASITIWGAKEYHWQAIACSMEVPGVHFEQVVEDNTEIHWNKVADVLAGEHPEIKLETLKQQHVLSQKPATAHIKIG